MAPSRTTQLIPRLLARPLTSRGCATTHPNPPEQRQHTIEIVRPSGAVPSCTRQKTQAELDEEIRMKLDAVSGEGGEAGVEYENGRPVAMKRAVKENMFRVI